MDEQRLFNGTPLFEKEAAPNFRPMLGALGNALKVFRRVPREEGEAASLGKFVLKHEDSAVNPESAHFFSENEVADKVKKESIQQGTGGFIPDGLLGLTKMIAPGLKEPIENGVYKMKQTVEKGDTALGSAIAGKNPNSLWGKLWSTRVTPEVGKIQNGEGSASKLLREDRRPSFVAPISNAVKVTTPLLAATYVGEKLYPQDKQQESNHPPYEENLDKGAFFDESFVQEMDKMASMQKIAELEDSLAEVESKLEKSAMEKIATEKLLEETIREKASFEKRASMAEENLLEKVAEFEELRLRTIAQKRSKVAVDLSEQLLEAGIVKQAHMDETIDRLMECDDSTIKMYENMVKDSKKQDESLESLAFLREYKINDKLATPSDGTSALSKRGQTIGEAARDLNKR